VEARERRFAAGSYDRLRGARAGRMPSEIEDDAAKRVQRAVRTWEARRAVAFRRELVLNLAALCAEEPQLVPRVVRLQAIARGVAVRSFFLRSATAAATSTGEACTQGMGDAQGLSGQGSESMEGGGMVSPDMSPIASPVLEKGGGRMLSEPPTSPISMHQGALYLKGGGGKGGERGGGGVVGGRPALPEGTPHRGQANGVGGGGRGEDSLDISAASWSCADSSLSESPGRGARRGAGRSGGGGGSGVRSARSPARRSDGWSPNKSAKSQLRSSSSFSAGLKLPNIPSSAKPILAHVAQVCVCLYLCLCGVSVRRVFVLVSCACPRTECLMVYLSQSEFLIWGHILVLRIDSPHGVS
jgi:hypothetical protein